MALGAVAERRGGWGPLASAAAGGARGRPTADSGSRVLWRARRPLLPPSFFTAPPPPISRPSLSTDRNTTPNHTTNNPPSPGARAAEPSPPNDPLAALLPPAPADGASGDDLGALLADIDLGQVARLLRGVNFTELEPLLPLLPKLAGLAPALAGVPDATWAKIGAALPKLLPLIDALDFDVLAKLAPLLQRLSKFTPMISATLDTLNLLHGGKAQVAQLAGVQVGGRPVTLTPSIFTGSAKTSMLGGLFGLGRR